MHYLVGSVASQVLMREAGEEESEDGRDAGSRVRRAYPAGFEDGGRDQRAKPCSQLLEAGKG